MFFIRLALSGPATETEPFRESTDPEGAGAAGKEPNRPDLHSEGGS